MSIKIGDLLFKPFRKCLSSASILAMYSPSATAMAELNDLVGPILESLIISRIRRSSAAASEIYAMPSSYEGLSHTMMNSKSLDVWFRIDSTASLNHDNGSLQMLITTDTFGLLLFCVIPDVQ